MFDLEEYIQQLVPIAVEYLRKERSFDDRAVDAMQDPSSDGAVTVLKNWLEAWKVFQGFEGQKRSAIARVALDWSMTQGEETELQSLDALIRAHDSLQAACSNADGRGRDFTSLAAKALWLRYPGSVPIYDQLAQQALWTISKFEPDLVPAPSLTSRYAQFASVWKMLYDRNVDSFANISDTVYPYKVRVFDWILWRIGEPRYGLSVPLKP